MAKLTKEELLNAIAEMTVLELSELVKAVEEKFGVKAAAPAVAVAAAPAAGAGAAAAEEKDEFNVVLASVDVKENVAKAEAEEMKKKITEAGGTVELK